MKIKEFLLDFFKKQKGTLEFDKNKEFNILFSKNRPSDFGLYAH